MTPSIAPTRRSRNARLERIVRGFSSRRRIVALRLLNRRPGLLLTEITRRLGISKEAAWEHLRKMRLAGLLLRQRRGGRSPLGLTERGLRVLAFLETLDRGS